MEKIRFRDDLYADVRTERRFKTQISFFNGEVKQMTEVDTTNAFLRVFDGEMWYYASTTNVNDIQHELDELYSFAKPNANISDNPIVKAFEVNMDKRLKFENDGVDKIPLDKKKEFIAEALPKLKSPHMNAKRATYLDRYSRFKFLSSKGADIEYDYQTCGYAFSVQLANGNDNFSNQLSDCKARFSELSVDEKKLTEFLDENENFLMNAKKLETPGNYPVILAPVVTGVFAHESFGHKSEADFMLGDETLRKEWSLGKKVGSDILTIVDAGDLGESGYVPYDDEGTKARETYLIENGVLTGRLHSVSTAVALGEKPTGNARAVSCDYEPIVRMTNTFVKAGDKTLDELLSGIDYGFFIKGLSHGSGLSTFTIAPTICYEIRNGKICDPVKIAVLTGNVFETLSLVDGLSKDFELLSFVTGGCGKMEQNPLPVGFGGPYMRVKEMGVQ